MDDRAASAWVANRGSVAAAEDDGRDDDKIRRAENRPAEEEEDRSMIDSKERIINYLIGLGSFCSME